jgi:glycosyltransferase involved in cell wall biosynthesis
MRQTTNDRRRFAMPATPPQRPAADENPVDNLPYNSRARVLFLSCHLPWPALSGGRRRELELIKRLARWFDIHLLVISKTPQQDRANISQLRHHCGQVDVFAASPPRRGALALAQAPQLQRHRCPAAARRASEILTRREVDLVHVEGFYLMQHVPNCTETPILLVEQNIEYELECQRAVTAPDPVGVRDVIRTRLAELECWARATRVAAVTPEDRQTILAALPHARVGVIPDGADHVPNLRVIDGVPPLERPQAPLAMLLANFAYAPNVDAALYLVKQILPLVRRRAPETQLWLVGNAPPPTVQALQDDGIIVTGQVPDVVPYLDVADVVVCPLRIGGGIKVKAIEALRRGKAIVSTSIGAQGLPSTAREAIAIADEPAAFARELTTLLLDPVRRSAHERRASIAAKDLPRWDDAAEQLAALYAELLQRNPMPAARAAVAPTAGGGPG